MRKFEQISAVRIFGSAARGDSDDLSDTDVLVVQRTKTSEFMRKHVEIELNNLGSQVSVCWYSEVALAKMFSEGHLFAWHLFKESFNPYEPHDYIDDLKTPNRYTSAVADIRGFREIISGINSSLRESAGNACYEAGLLFVCCRNIAMIASSYLEDGPYFGRSSPFNLGEVSGIKFPLSSVEHVDNMKARSFGHRGIYMHHSVTDVCRMAIHVDDWSRAVLNLVETWERSSERQKYAIH
jgi:predicted nucleotidyltransferase